MRSHQSSVQHLRECLKFYTHLIQKHYSWLVVNNRRKLQLEPTLAQQPKDDVIAKYRDWMRDSYSTCKERLLHLLHHQSPDVQVREGEEKSLLHQFFLNK